MKNWIVIYERYTRNYPGFVLRTELGMVGVEAENVEAVEYLMWEAHPELWIKSITQEKMNA